MHYSRPSFIIKRGVYIVSSKNFEGIFNYEGDYTQIGAQEFVEKIISKSQIVDPNSPIGSILQREFPEILKNSIDSVREKRSKLIEKLEILTNKINGLNVMIKNTQDPVRSVYIHLINIYKKASSALESELANAYKEGVVSLGVEISDDDKNITFKIKDQGKGFPEAWGIPNDADIDYEFRLGKGGTKIQSDKVGKEDQLGGRGLGLAGIHLFLKHFGGRILIRNNKNTSGACITLISPSAKQIKLSSKQSDSYRVREMIQEYMMLHSDYIKTEDANTPSLSCQLDEKSRFTGCSSFAMLPLSDRGSENDDTESGIVMLPSTDSDTENDDDNTENKKASNLPRGGIPRLGVRLERPSLFVLQDLKLQSMQQKSKEQKNAAGGSRPATP